MNRSLTALVAIIALFALSCTGAPEPVPVIDIPVEEPNEEPIADIPAEPVEEEPAEEPLVEDENYEVSQEVYDLTFSEIEDLIEELNTVISKRDFDRWTNHLSIDYIRRYEDDEVLAEISQSPQLKAYDIVLTSLRDYFNWVVVPSRSQVLLSEIVFIDEQKVIAYASYDGQRAKLYELERIGGDWKITVW